MYPWIGIGTKNATALGVLAVLLTAPVASSAIGETVPTAKLNGSEDSRQLNLESQQLKAVLESFNRKIDDAETQIKTLQDGGEKRKALTSLQIELSKALSATADNGKIASLGQQVLDSQEQWLKELGTRHYNADRLESLSKNFQTSIYKTRQVLKEIHEVRGQLSDALKSLQNEQQYLLDLERAGDAQQMTEVLEGILHELHSTLAKVRSIVNNVPGV